MNWQYFAWHPGWKARFPEEPNQGPFGAFAMKRDVFKDSRWQIFYIGRKK